MTDNELENAFNDIEKLFSRLEQAAEAAERRRSRGFRARARSFPSVQRLTGAIFRARQRQIETALISLITGERPGGDAPRNAASSNGALLNVFADMVEGMVVNALNKPKTRVTSVETDRSREAESLWKISRGQQEANLAEMAARGQRNL